MASDSKFAIVKTLTQFGFVKKGESGDQVYGVCPFCERTKFYVNEEKHLWDCKGCGKEGGFYTFLEEIVEHCRKNLRPSGLGKRLAEDRGLAEGTLVRAHVGYNPVNDTFLIPNYFPDSKKILNISIYNGKRVYSTHGCKVGLYGWEKLSKDIENIWLCEGIWDWLIMCEILQMAGKKKDIALGAPGSGTFKGEWCGFFEGKKTGVIYDNDEPGKLGNHKVHNSLIHYASDLRHVVWPKKLEGYDLRDFYHDHKNKAFSTLKSVRMLLQPLPAPAKTKTGKTLIVQKKEKREYKGKGSNYEDVYKAYRKHLHLPNTEVIDVLFGTLLANRLDGDPLWLFMVAPSGGTKTEMLLSVSGAVDIEVISSLTPRTLVSGMTLEGGVDPSLLPKLNGKVLIIKDFTAILSMNKVHRDEILGDLRDAYDGEFSKPFGNAQWKKYKSRFGIIAGVTPEIEHYLADCTAMGERFLRYMIPIDNSIKGRKGYIRRALGNVGIETGIREQLQKIANEVLDYDYKSIPPIPDHLKERIVSLAHWICMVRGVVSRDRYTRHITNSPHIEVGTRVAKQLCKLAYGIGMFKRKKVVGEEEYKAVVSMARGSVIKDYEMVFRYLYKKQKEMSTGEIAEGLHLPSNLIDRIAQDLKLTKVFHKKKISAFGAKWSVNPEVVELVEECRIYG